MLHAILAYINHHLEEEISLEQLAQFSGYSSFHLHHKLREEMEEPIGSFIERQRIQKAGYLLSLTKIPVAEIKMLVGYDNDSAFSRAFKKIYQVSPSAYRKQQRHLTGHQETYVSLKAEVVRLPEQKAIVFPTLTNYLTKDSYLVWDNVASYLQDHGLKEEDFDYYSVLHDCQNINEDSLSRYDAVLVCKKDSKQVNSKYFSTVLPSGKFVKYKFCCPVSEYKNMGMHVNRHLLEESGMEHVHGASYFKFQQLPLSQHSDHLLIEWFIPVK
ncbi:AraC family transcriptional regulator [Rufibacter sp. DG15C]|uniref:AraC family transcriptional regulator n=1 Tax=Rufibacter sp. DG15C TaxID=1379909 RepID=UPI00082EB093|nr:AraC family transcriptional regulator [Rufibacter sp. DG15C]